MNYISEDLPEPGKFISAAPAFLIALKAACNENNVPDIWLDLPSLIERATNFSEEEISLEL